MELKFAIEELLGLVFNSSNRTFMELKWMTAKREDTQAVF